MREEYVSGRNQTQEENAVGLVNNILVGFTLFTKQYFGFGYVQSLNVRVIIAGQMSCEDGK